MKKNEKILLLRVITIVLMTLFIILPTIANAWTISDDLPSAQGSDLSSTTSSIMNSVQGVVKAAAESLMITMLIYLGIKYITSAPEGRAEYKKLFLPYIVGVILIHNADDIVRMLESVGNGNTDAAKNFVNPYVESFGRAVESVGKTLAVIMLVIIGIKYVMAAPEGKAEYRKTMVPYVIGAVLIYTASTLAPQLANAEYTNIVSNQLSPLEVAVKNAGVILATIMLIVIGIKYMTSAPEGKAEYRKIMIPYLVGAVIIFTTSVGSNAIINTIISQAGGGGNGETYTSESHKILIEILSVLRYVGVGMAIIMLIVLAIKYMSAAPEGKAEIQKTASPYIIGAVVLFAASSIVDIIKTFAMSI